MRKPALGGIGMIFNTFLAFYFLSIDIVNTIKKVSTTIRLDNDVLLYLKKIASLRKVKYQTLLNSLLREYMQKGVIDRG